VNGWPQQSLLAADERRQSELFRSIGVDLRSSAANNLFCALPDNLSFDDFSSKPENGPIHF
jgi:hypothetical protein